MRNTIKAGQVVTFFKEYQDPGDEKHTFIAMEDESGGRVRVYADLGLQMNPNMVVSVHTINSARPMWGIWTTISGDLGGNRSGWAKENGKFILCDSPTDAARLAASLQEKTALRGGKTPSGWPIATQTFMVREFSIVKDGASR